MKETGGMASEVELLEEDLTSAFESHEAIVAGLSRLLAAAQDLAPAASAAEIDRPQPRCA